MGSPRVEQGRGLALHLRAGQVWFPSLGFDRMAADDRKSIAVGLRHAIDQFRSWGERCRLEVSRTTQGQRCVRMVAK